jgi:hypothetical protein
MNERDDNTVHDLGDGSVPSDADLQPGDAQESGPDTAPGGDEPDPATLTEDERDRAERHD